MGNELFIDAISRQFGVDPQTLMLIIITMAAIIIGIVMYFWTRVPLLAHLSSGIVLGIGVFVFYVIPLWILLLYAIMGVFMFFMGSQLPDTEEVTEGLSGWAAYGNRIKKAYEAKFGYTNPQFNEEVDMRVKQVECLKGSTAMMAKFHLKRYGSMTNCK